MKKRIFPFAAVVLLLASCSTGYVVTDNVSRHLDGTRVVLSADTSTLGTSIYGHWQRETLAERQVVDFRTFRDTMRYAYSQAIPLGGWSVQDDSLSRMLCPQVTVSRHFRWFFTRYRYQAVFAAMDSLPVPVSEYLTEEEQHMLFQPSSLPADWNGADMYALLDDLNTKYVRWWGHCCFEKEYEMYYCMADSMQRSLLAQYHDTLLTLVLADLFKDERESMERKARLFPELDFVGRDESVNDVPSDVIAWKNTCFESQDRVLWRVALPGGRTNEFMVSSERLIMGDYAVCFDSCTLNWWAIILTLLLVLAAIWFPLRRH